MKMKPEQITEIFGTLVAECKPLFAIQQNEDFLNFVTDKSDLASIRQIAQRLANAARACFELNKTYVDLVTTYRMSRRYPWRGTQITKSQHLEFVWVQFINQCYLFREKYKLAMNQLNKCNESFGEPPVSSNELKTVDHNLKKFIRARGQHFHEWFEHNVHIETFTYIELLNSIEKQEGPLGDLSGHYSDAKWFLSNEIETAAMFMERHLKREFRAHIKTLIRELKLFDRLLREMESNVPASKRTVTLR